MNVGYTQKLGSALVVGVYEPRVRHTSYRGESVGPRRCGGPRARRAPNWTSFCGSARTPPKRCCARARVLIAATRRGDGVASALARGHGSGGGSESATASVHGLLLRKRCAACSCRTRRAQQLAPSSWAGLAPRRPRPRRRAALSDKGEQSSNRCSPTRAVAYVC